MECGRILYWQSRIYKNIKCYTVRFRALTYLCVKKPLQGTCFCADSGGTRGLKQYDLYGLVSKRPWTGYHVHLFRTNTFGNFSQLFAGRMAMRRCISLWLRKMRNCNDQGDGELLSRVTEPPDYSAASVTYSFSQCYRLFEISQNPSMWEALRITIICSKAGQYINSLSLSWYETTCHLRFWTLFYRDMA